MYSIVMVDDDPWMLKWLDGTIPFDELGLGAPVCASSAQAAMEHIERQPPDILLTDIKMDRMSGIDLLNAVKKISPRTRVIMLSGHHEFSYAMAALKGGATDYLLKPVQEDELIGLLKRVVSELGDERPSQAPQSGEAAPGDADQQPRTRKVIEDAKRYVLDNLNSELTLDAVSRVFCLHPSYFCRLFSESTGKTFTRFVMQARIGYAKELLRNTHLKVYEISARVGYPNEKYFSRVFKELEGISAIEYRENVKIVHQ